MGPVDDFECHPSFADVIERMEKAETERNEWEARAVRAEGERDEARTLARGYLAVNTRVTDEKRVLRDQRDRAVEALRTAQAEFQGIAGSAGQPFIVRRASFASVDIQGAIAQLQPEAPRGVSDRSDASTTDHERTPQESSSGSSNSDTEDR